MISVVHVLEYTVWITYIIKGFLVTDRGNGWLNIFGTDFVKAVNLIVENQPYWHFLLSKCDNFSQFEPLTVDVWLQRTDRLTALGLVLEAKKWMRLNEGKN